MLYEIKRNSSNDEFETNLKNIDKQTIAFFFKELAYYAEMLHATPINKIQIEGVYMDNRFYFHEAFYERSGVVREFAMETLDKLFLNKNGVVPRTAHSCNHGGIWYLKQLTQEPIEQKVVKPKSPSVAK